MTGAYVRIWQDGGWHNVEIDQLTDAELQTFFWQQDPARIVTWAVFLAGWIRDHVQEGARHG